VNRLAALLAAALLMGAAAPAAASGSFCGEVRECLPDEPPSGPRCVASKWRFFAARNANCEDLKPASAMALLCYFDDAGQRQRWKFFRWTPAGEAKDFAERMNALNCKR
jgi:hypothetical protein